MLLVSGWPFIWFLVLPSYHHRRITPKALFELFPLFCWGPPLSRLFCKVFHYICFMHARVIHSCTTIWNLLSHCGFHPFHVFLAPILYKSTFSFSFLIICIWMNILEWMAKYALRCLITMFFNGDQFPPEAFSAVSDFTEFGIKILLSPLFMGTGHPK